MKKSILFLFFLISFSFCSYLWDATLDSDTGTTALVYKSKILVGTESGNLYSIDANSGSKKLLKTNLGEEILSLVEFNGKILAIMRNGTIHTITISGDTGIIEKSNSIGVNVFGIEKTEGKIYLSTTNGIFTFDGTTIKQISSGEGSYTAPTVYSGKIIVGVNETLVAFSSTGEILWETKLAPFWNTKPVVYANMVYIGSMDHYLYAIDFNTGEKIWWAKTGGAITSEVIIDGGIIYTGSNDGYLYSVKATDGEINWKGKTSAGIFSKPIASKIGIVDVIIVGSNDGKVNAFDRGTGELVWGYTTTGSIKKIVGSGNNIIVSSGDTLYALSMLRGCVLLEPEEQTKVGYKEITVKGKIFSSYGEAQASINVNSGVEETIQVDGEGNFEYLLNPNDYAFGIIYMGCKVVDSSGVESEGVQLILVRVTDLPKSEFTLNYKPTVKTGEEIIIYVNDAENGEVVQNFVWVMDGKSKSGSETIEITNANEGTVKIKISKQGYTDKNIEIKVEGNFMNLVIYAIVGVIGLLALAYVYFAKIKKRD